MKKQHALLFTILFSIFTNSVFAQQCSDYPCVIKKVKRFIAEKKYQDAFDNLESADGYPAKKADEISALRKQLFAAIEKEKNEAKKAKDAAKKALKQVEIEKQMAIAEKTKAQAAEAKAKAVLDKIYFYDGKFGLAYNHGHYGFIDKDLYTKIEFKYDEAIPYDYTNFAKVKKYNIYYFIDTLGSEYKLATDINQLDSTMLAADFRSKKLKIIPPSVFEHRQLQILLLNSNQLDSLPAEIGQLDKLTELNLSTNQLTTLPAEIVQLDKLTELNLRSNQLDSLPAEIEKLDKLTELGLSFNKLTKLHREIGQLNNLTFLDLRNNKLTNLPVEIEKLGKLKRLYLSNNRIRKEEREKIKKLIPNCKIEF